MLGRNRGLAEIPLIIGLLIMAIAIPAASKLVQQNQANLPKAGEWECSTSAECSGGRICVSHVCVQSGCDHSCGTRSDRCSDQTWTNGCGETCHGTKDCRPTAVPTAQPAPTCEGGHNPGDMWCDGNTAKRCDNFYMTSSNDCGSRECRGGNCADRIVPTTVPPTAVPTVPSCDAVGNGCCWAGLAGYCNNGLVCNSGGVCANPQPAATPTAAGINVDSWCKPYDKGCDGTKSYMCTTMGVWQYNFDCKEKGCDPSTGICYPDEIPTLTPTPACLADGVKCYSWPGAPLCDSSCCNGSHEKVEGVNKMLYCGPNPNPNPNCLPDGTECWRNLGSPKCESCCNSSYTKTVGVVNKDFCGPNLDPPTPMPTIKPNCNNMGGCATWAETCCVGDKVPALDCVPPVACRYVPISSTPTPAPTLIPTPPAAVKSCYCFGICGIGCGMFSQDPGFLALSCPNNCGGGLPANPTLTPTPPAAGRTCVNSAGSCQNVAEGGSCRTDSGTQGHCIYTDDGQFPEIYCKCDPDPTPQNGCWCRGGCSSSETNYCTTGYVSGYSQCNQACCGQSKAGCDVATPTSKPACYCLGFCGEGCYVSNQQLAFPYIECADSCTTRTPPVATPTLPDDVCETVCRGKMGSSYTRCLDDCEGGITPTIRIQATPTLGDGNQCYCNGNCGLEDCRWANRGVAPYTRGCDNSFCEGLLHPTKVLTPTASLNPPNSTPTTGGPNPTNPPGGGSWPTNPPGGSGNECPYHSLQARVQKDSTSEWVTSLSDAVAGETINVGCMHDGSGQLANNVKITVTNITSGLSAGFGTNLSQWTIPRGGSYRVSCESTDPKCSLNSGSDGSVFGSGGCKDCPLGFACFKNGNSYKWFADGYQMLGYSRTYVVNDRTIDVVEEDCTSRSVVKPTFLGKGKGDGNCDGRIDIYDQSVWGQEFSSTRGIDESKPNWEADFNCDTKVNIYDLPIWSENYKGGNQ